MKVGSRLDNLEYNSALKHESEWLLTILCLFYEGSVSETICNTELLNWYHLNFICY